MTLMKHMVLSGTVRVSLLLLAVLAIASAPAAAQVTGSRDAGRADAPLALSAALELAREASQSLRRSRLGVDVARAELDEARSAHGPTINATAGTAYIANPPEGITIPAGEFGTVTDPRNTFPTRVPDQPVVLVPDPENLGLSASVELRQPLYTWGKLSAGRRAAKAGLNASAARVELSERELRRQVSTAYAGVVAGRESLPRMEEIVSLLEVRLRDAREQLDAGALTRNDVLAEEAALAGARLQLVRAQQGLQTAESTLSWLVGGTIGRLERDAGWNELPVTLPSEDVLVRRARSDDPRLSELRATSSRAQVQLEVAEASRPLLPDIGLTVKAEVQGQRVPLAQANWIDTWDANLTISVGANAALFDSGANAAERGAARARYEQSLSAIVEYEDSLPLQVRSSLEAYLVARASLAEADARTASAAEQERIAEVSYENELITRSELLGARVARLEAELGAVAARLELARSLFDLEYRVGPLLE
jgi:outer membrane protein